jgi:DNA-binding beta-propeller fold protein YncE
MNGSQMFTLAMAVLSTTTGALAQATERTLFITNRDSNSVTSFRVTNSGALLPLGVFPVASPPQDCALTADGRQLIVLSSDDNSSAPEKVTVFTVTPSGALTNAAVGTVPDAPLALGISPSGFILVPSTTSDRIDSLRVNGGSVTPVSNAPAGTFPFRPVSSADSRFVYCAGSISPDDIVTFSLSPNGQLARLGAIDIPSTAAFGVALHPSGTTLYVSTGQNNAIRWYSVNQATGALAFGGSINPGGNSVTEIAVTPDAQWLFSVHVLSDTLSVQKINADGSLTSTGFSYNITSDARDVVTDGRHVFVSDETLLGGVFGVHVFSINPTVGNLLPVGPAVSTGGFLPQFMALWAPPVCIGDVNGDHIVAFNDITDTLSNFGGTGNGDADFDGDVDFADVTAILENFGDTCGR